MYFTRSHNFLRTHIARFGSNLSRQNTITLGRSKETFPIAPLSHSPFSTTNNVYSDEKPILSDLSSDGVLTLSLNRPKARNSFSRLLIQNLINELQKIRFDPNVRTVIFASSSPGMFCAGADLKERATMKEEEVGPFVQSLRDTLSLIEKLPMPTIAAIDGAALGGGLELALACDIRVASSKAIIGLTETSLAIIPGAGGTQRLPRLIGTGKAKELIFTAQRLNSREALDIGLVNKVAESKEGNTNDRGEIQIANEIAAKIAKNGPVAVRMAKTAISQGMECDSSTGMEIERACYAQIIPTSDRLEGLKAFKEKRIPNYQGK